MSRGLLIERFLIALILSGLFGRYIAAAPPVVESRRDVIVLRHCDVDFEQSTLVSGHSGTGMALPLQDCLVRLGDRVKAGQVLGRLWDRDLRVQLALHTAEADTDIAVRLAESKRNELGQKLKRIEKLRANAQAYASEEEHETARVLYESAQLMIEDAKYKRKMAKIQALETDALIKVREIVAPHDGIVVEVFKKQGETVLPGQPVFQIVEADRLRVTAYSNLSDFGRIRPGQRIEIGVETDALDPEILRRTFEGKVLFVDKRIDSKSQTCRIVAQVENEDLTLSAGLEARMTIFTARNITDTRPRNNPLTAPSIDRGAPAARTAAAP